MNRLHLPETGRARSRGQILPIFVILLTAILLMASLLLDASMALLMRRDYQNAADAGALAGANVVRYGADGCSLVDGPPPGAPRAAVVAAVVNSVQTNIPGFDASHIVVTCPSGPNNFYQNYAVGVQLTGDSPGFLSQLAGIDAFHVVTKAVAINGWNISAKWSVVELNPYHESGWGPQDMGCPSLEFDGGPTVTFGGSVHVNSKCPADGNLKGAMSGNGSSATVTFENGGTAFLSGGFDPSTPANAGITPLPQTYTKQIPDPLAGMPAPSLTANAPCTGNCIGNNTNLVLRPGVYPNGISLNNSQRVFLTPGLYIMKNGGFHVGSQASAYSVNKDFVYTAAWNESMWASSSCVSQSTCGVMIYNMTTSSWNVNLDQIEISAGGVVKLRPYSATAAAGNGSVVQSEWNNVLIFEARTPAPTSSKNQAPISLQGGGSVFMSGTVYAPGAKVSMHGGGGGSGGNSADLTIQFISYDLLIAGSTFFHFNYSSNRIAAPTQYGLVE